MIAVVMVALTLAVTDTPPSTRINVRMSDSFDLSFIPPVGCVWDGERFLECKSAIVYLGGYQPARESWFSDFATRLREETRRTRRAHGKTASERLTIGGPPAGAIRYTGLRHQAVIDLLIGVPEDSLGHIFNVVADETGRQTSVETMYRQLVKSFEVVRRDVPPN
jgi:hypothetical protein